MDIDYGLLRSAFGIAYPRPYQELVIASILSYYETGAECRMLAVLPTGGGKSLCFMYPMLRLGGKALVIYPLLSLMTILVIPSSNKRLAVASADAPAPLMTTRLDFRSQPDSLATFFSPAQIL